MFLKVLTEKLITGTGRKMLIAFFVRGLGAISGLIMSIVVARSLSVDEAGLLFLAFTIVSILASFSGLGLNHTVLRYIGSATENNWQEINSVYRFAVQYVGIAAIVSATGLWWMADGISLILGKPDMAPILRTIAPSVAAMALFYLHAHVLQALHETIFSIFILNIAAPLILSVLLIAINPRNAEYTGVLYSISTVITLGLAIWLWWRHHWAVWPRNNSIRLWSSCLPLWMAVIAGQFVIWGGQLVAGFHISPNELAYLAVAQKLSITTSFILVVVNLVMAPRYAALWRNRNLHQLEKLAKNSTWLIVVYVLPLVTVIFFFAEEILWLFGKEYVDAAPLLRILVTGQLANAITGSVGYLLMMSGHEKDIRNISVVFGVVGLLLPIWLIPRYGVIGAAVSTALIISLQNAVMYILVKRRLGFWTLGFYKK